MLENGVRLLPADDDSWRLEAYLRRGGYETARKVLTTMAPAAVIAEVRKAALRGRGGAGFPAGVKWGFVPQGGAGPKYLCVNADEAEPGTFKDRFVLLRAPHQLLEGMLITAFAVGIRSAFIYVRGEYAQVVAAAGGGHRRGPGRGIRRAARLRHGFRPRRRRPPRRRGLHLRRGDGASRIARGTARAAARQAAFPGGRRPLPLAHGHQQRRNARHRALRSWPTARIGSSAGAWPRTAGRGCWRQRRRPAPRHLRARRGDAAPGDHRGPRRRSARRPGHQGGHPRRAFRAGPHGRGDRRRHGRRFPGPGGLHARLGGDHRHPRGDARCSTSFTPRPGSTPTNPAASARPAASGRPGSSRSSSG